MYGGPNLPETVDLATLGSGGVVIFGADAGDISSHFVDAADVNGDEIDDLVIGARFADGRDDQASGAGESYVIYGRVTLSGTIDLCCDERR